MNALTKSLQASRAFCHSVETNAIRLKQSGLLADVMAPGPSSGFGDYQAQTKQRRQYNLFRGWLYSVINAIALEGCQQPVMMGRTKGATPIDDERGSPSKVKRFHRRKMTKTAGMKAARTELEMVENDPILDTLEQPNFMQMRNQFVYTFIANLCLTGWGYIVAAKGKGKDGEERLELYSLPTTWVRPSHKKGLFSEFYIVDPSKPEASQKNKKPLSRDMVGFAHLPNPADPRSALSPAESQMQAVRIDDHIQTSQEAFFENGIFPSAIVTMAEKEFRDTKGRPVLTQAQRRQITSALTKTAGGVSNYGKFIIVDGLIDKILPMGMKQNEMGWEKSEDKIRTRILSAFGVHPFILGEVINVSGYSQATAIREQFYDRVNGYLDMLSVVVTNLVGNYLQDKGTLIWWEECIATDPSLRQKSLLAMRRNGDITQNEIRGEEGFAPDEDHNEQLITNQIAGHVRQVMVDVGNRLVAPEQAVAMLEALGLPTEDAGKIAGVGLEREEETVGEAVEVLEAAVAALGITPKEIADHLIQETRK